MLSWAMILIALVLLLGGLFSIVVIFSLSRSATGGDIDWQLDRLERKVDLILTHLGIGHDDHIPESVVALTRAGRTQEAVQEYCRMTGSRLSVARREIAFLAKRSKGRADDELQGV